MISDPKAEAAVRAVLRNPKHPLLANLWGKVADRGYGRPQQRMLTVPLNVDVRDLTDEQIERMLNGEDPLAVLARRHDASR